MGDVGMEFDEFCEALYGVKFKSEKARKYLKWFSSRKWRNEIYEFFDRQNIGIVSFKDLKEGLNEMCLEITEQLPCEEFEHELPWDIDIARDMIEALSKEKASLNMDQFCEFIYKNALPSQEKMRKKKKQNQKSEFDEEAQKKREWCLNRFYAKDFWKSLQMNAKKQADRKEICDN